MQSLMVVLLVVALVAFVVVVLRRLDGIDARMSQSSVASQALSTDIFKTLGALEGATQSMAAQAKEFSAFQDLFKAPKARGGLGEAMLEELLRQVLPPSAYRMQYRFSTGVIVDAMVLAGGRKICIDSKFPLANFQRLCESTNEDERVAASRDLAADIDGHIRDIAARYIVPDEGTLDFAVMYVPSEAVYSEMLRLNHRRRSLFEAAIEQRVIPMSPLTIYPYLQTIMLGLRSLRIEENAAAILDQCSRLGHDLARFASDYDVLGRHIGNAYSKFGENQRNLERLRSTFDRLIDVEDSDDERPPLEAIAGD